MSSIKLSGPDFEDLEPDGICPKCGEPMFLLDDDIGVKLYCSNIRCNKSLFCDPDEYRSILDYDLN